MDSSRFDSIARSLGRGLSRREALKAALGFGSAALVGTKLAPETEAARRPTPTPKPIVCPYPKVLSGGQCVCPVGTDACGPDCCPPDAECFDNACCFGACYGEELCCPSGSFVCDDQCRPFFEGACCVDSNCDSNQICSDGVCTNVCIPTDSTG